MFWGFRLLLLSLSPPPQIPTAFDRSPNIYGFNFGDCSGALDWNSIGATGSGDCDDHSFDCICSWADYDDDGSAGPDVLGKHVCFGGGHAFRNGALFVLELPQI